MDHTVEGIDGARDLASVARTIVDSNLYMTLATADAAGRSWASPVWYAASGYAEFYWVSSSEWTARAKKPSSGSSGRTVHPTLQSSPVAGYVEMFLLGP